MSKAAVKPAKKSFADFDMDAMDFSAVPANTEFKAAGRFQRLPLADIDPDPAQVRREFDQAEIDALAAENNPATALNDDGRCVVGLFRLTGGARLVIGTLGKRRALPFPLVVAGLQFGPLPTLICCTGGSCHRRARLLGQR